MLTRKRTRPRRSLFRIPIENQRIDHGYGRRMVWSVLLQSTLPRGIPSSRTIGGSVSLSPGNDAENHNARAESCHLYTIYQPIILHDRARASCFLPNVSILFQKQEKKRHLPLPTFHRPPPKANATSFLPVISQTPTLYFLVLYSLNKISFAPSASSTIPPIGLHPTAI